MSIVLNDSPITSEDIEHAFALDPENLNAFLTIVLDLGIEAAAGKTDEQIAQVLHDAIQRRVVR